MSMIFALSLMLLSTPATATGDTPANDAAQNAPEAKPKKEKPKKICRDNKQDTGSRINKRVCKTQEEWDSELDDQELQGKSKVN